VKYQLLIKSNTFSPFLDISMAIVVLHFPMNHQVMLHMQKVIEKMLPQIKEALSMNVGAHP
jgi:hypothetical protein